MAKGEIDERSHAPNMTILKNGANTIMITMLPIHAYPSETPDVGSSRRFMVDPFSVSELLVFNPMTSASESS